MTSYIIDNSNNNIPNISLKGVTMIFRNPYGENQTTVFTSNMEKEINSGELEEIFTMMFETPAFNC